jgi:hypothetical protein
LGDPSVHYRIHNSPLLLISVLSQTNSLHTASSFPPHLFVGPPNSQTFVPLPVRHILILASHLHLARPEIFLDGLHNNAFRVGWCLLQSLATFVNPYPANVRVSS